MLVNKAEIFFHRKQFKQARVYVARAREAKFRNEEVETRAIILLRRMAAAGG